MDPSPIEGYCPMGCGQTLAVQDGTISCQAPECPRPGLLHEMLFPRVCAPAESAVRIIRGGSRRLRRQEFVVLGSTLS